MVGEDEFRECVLGFISNDFEAPATIAGDIASAMGCGVTEAEVLGALLELARHGRAQAYLYNAGLNRYDPVEVDKTPRDQLWFKAR